MKNFLPILWIFLAFLAVQCGKTTRESVAQNTSNHDIIVYGSMTCDHCIDFLKKADSIAVKYTFRDVETNANYYDELVAKIQTANYQGYVSFPVIEIDGKISVNPSFEEFMKMLN